MSESEIPIDRQSISDVNWNVDTVVSRLKKIREQSQLARQRIGHSAKLPSRKKLASIVERIGTALFPVRLSFREFPNGNVDYFVGHTLDETLSELADEVERELCFFAAAGQTDFTAERREAVRIVRGFAERLPAIRVLLESDIQAAYEGDPAARSSDEVLACYPGVMAMMHHRLAHELYLLNVSLVARIIAEVAHSLTGIDIHPGAQIQEEFFIDHGTGVVIGETAVIGKRVRIYQAVTLGAKSFPSGDDGVLIKGSPRHPVVEDNVVIYAGATILGRITIGKGSVIGGNVWLTTGVPPGSQISQAKLRSEIYDSGSGI
ncbi:MAG TPA: serine O-acetyltransferase EpsC [Planctomicrobium sp.]|nr:serine O-acetyltransferase EpsC [Planctomicrobium sp.]